MEYIDKLNKNLLKIFYLIVCFYIYVLLFTLFLFKFDFYNETQFQMFHVVIYFVFSISIFLYLLFYKREKELKKILWFLGHNIVAYTISITVWLVFGYLSAILFEKYCYDFPKDLTIIFLMLPLSIIYIFEDFVRNKTPGEVRANWIEITGCFTSILSLSAFLFCIFYIKDILKSFIDLYQGNSIPFLELIKIILVNEQELIIRFLYLLLITFISIQHFFNYFIRHYEEKIAIRENALKESIKYFIYFLIFIFFITFGKIKIDFLDYLILMPFVIISSALMASLGSILELKTRTLIIYHCVINILLIFWFISYTYFNQELDDILLNLFNVNIALIVRGFMYGVGVIFSMGLGILISRSKDIRKTKNNKLK